MDSSFTFLKKVRQFVRHTIDANEMRKLAFLISAGFFISLALFVQGVNADITTSLLGYWKFDETTGVTAVDNSGGGNTGTLLNSPVWTTGKVSGGLSFDGVDDAVQIADGGAFNFGSGDFTVSAWFKTSSIQTKNIISKYIGSGRYAFNLQVGGSGLISFMSSDGASKQIGAADTPYEDGAWHHIVGVKDSAQLTLYIDNVLKGSTPFGGTVENSNYKTYIGARGYNNLPQDNYFPGLLDDVRIYNRALTQSDVATLYDFGGYQCNDDTDNDLDGLTDYPDDLGCSSYQDDNEVNSVSPSGDTTPPVISSIQAVNIFPTTADITFTTDDLAHTEINYAADSYYTSNSTYNNTDVDWNKVTAHSMTLTGLTPNTVYHYQIKSQNNSSLTTTTYTDYIFTTLSDNTASPVIPADPSKQTVAPGTPLPIIPGGKGFGINTYAGSGRNLAVPSTSVYKVTTLNPSGAGSLKECVDATGPRVCVFEISGVIDISSLGAWGLRVKNPYITIAGQTAPSPGIMLRGAPFIIETHDVLVQHIRIRPGDTLGSGCVIGPDNCDAVAVVDLYNENDVYNVVVDHASLSWSMDEIFSTWYPNVRDITLSNSILSEALHNSLHPKGPHGYGLIVGIDSSNISILGNLVAHNYQRNPLLSMGSETIVANNVFYNAGLMKTHADARSGLKSSIVGNVYLKGADYYSSVAPIYIYNSESSASVYISDNDAPGATSDPWSIVAVKPSDIINHASIPPVWVPSLSVLPSNIVKDNVLLNVGARPADRDPVDIRIINEVKNNTGNIINCVNSDGSVRCQKNAGGWPVLLKNYRKLIIPNNPNMDDDGDGYTNLEEWLHSYATQVEGVSVLYQCSDGMDNDSDGLTDYPNDPGCASVSDNDEYNVPADITPPVISNISASVTANSANITYATNEPGDTQIDYGLSTSYGTATNLNTTSVTSHSQTLNNLSPSTLYHYRVKSKDTSGNTSISTDRIFTTGGITDVTPPSAPTNLSTSFVNHTSITLNWTSPGDDGSVGTALSYDLRYSTSPITESSTPGGTSWSSATQAVGEPTPKIAGSPEFYTSTGLTASTTYYFAVKAIDDAGNTSIVSNIATDTTHSLTLSVNLSANNVTDPSSGNTTDSGNTSTSGGGGGSVTVSSGGGGGGGGGGNYYDTTPPEVPKSFTSQSAENQATLAWQNPPDTDFVRVAIVRSTAPIPNLSTFTQAKSQGTVIYEGTDNEYTDTNLLNNTPYYYAIYSYDKKPNYSNPFILQAVPKQGQTSITAQTTPATISAAQSSIALPTLTGPFALGYENDQVKLLQQYLANPPAGGKDIYPEGITSGYYGALTQRAVERFQCKYQNICSGSPSSTGYGLAGPSTRLKIMAIHGSTVTSSGGTVASASEDALKAQLMKQIEELQAILQQLLEQLVQALALQLEGLTQ
ncbi:MAG: fibronectin type III domain-containing protein [Parcubacteria group bacterium]|nr:fibronectin type III domain-containing protein [Parcubacteria group bacterium]MCR4343050.1 fibronectin type III domain-containing protein [Patescibacteria group bacterium]